MGEQQDVAFASGGVRCAGVRHPPADESLTGPDGAPAVVMAHGVGGTQDSGLEPFARALSGAGVHVLTFDYRGFGRSDGMSRQVVSTSGQVADYRAALAFAASLPGVDPRRLVVWGESLSGGTVVAAAAGRDDVAAVISMIPLLSGPAGAWAASRCTPPAGLARSSLLTARAAAAAVLRRPPVMMPLAGPPGSASALAMPGYHEDYLAIAGPTWRNEVAGSVAWEMARFRPGRSVRHLRAPWLVQIADFDRVAAPSTTASVAAKGAAEVRHYPCDHFDTQAGKPWHEPAVRHQILFLKRHLGLEAT